MLYNAISGAVRDSDTERYFTQVRWFSIAEQHCQFACIFTAQREVEDRSNFLQQRDASTQVRYRLELTSCW